MSFDAKRLYELLPALYQTKDAAEGYPLQALLTVIAREIGILEEDLAQFYDDQFIETCATWVIPYIGDVIGYRLLHGTTPEVRSRRAEVANTIGYRRRKGTATMLEQLAHDVTGWEARVVEFFQLLVTTQYMKHIRPDNRIVDLSTAEPLLRLGSAFDAQAHTLDIRRITGGAARYNIPNIGIFLWRIGSYPLTDSPAVAAQSGDLQRFLFHPLGFDTPLYNRTESETTITHLAERQNVPMPIGRREMAADPAAFYGPDASILVKINGTALMPAAGQTLSEVISVCDLSDITDTAGVITWANTPPPTGMTAIDPLLGRIAFSAPQAAPPLVSFYYGAVMEMGSGEYERDATINAELEPVISPWPTLAAAAAAFPVDRWSVENQAPPDASPQTPALSIRRGQHVILRTASAPTIGAALAEWNGTSGAIELPNSGRYVETPQITIQRGHRLEVRAADRKRPLLLLSGDMVIDAEDESVVTFNGLLIVGGLLRVRGELQTLRLVHCTLVPEAGRPSLVVESPVTRVEIERSIVGGLQVHREAAVRITNSIVDATAADQVAYTGATANTAGGTLEICNSTVHGTVFTTLLYEATHTIFLSTVRAERRQEGCVRFSYVPQDSRVPRRYRCQPETGADAARLHPQFTSLHYGDPAYGQLSRLCAREITEGAEDGVEMGAYHDLFQAQRERDLRTRLDEYLRFSLEAGIIYAS